VLGQNEGMLGAILMLIALFVVVPVGVIISGGIAAGVIGTTLKINGEKTHEGSELLETNV
jgi:hypothetical protein